MFKIRSLAGMGRGMLSFIFLFCAVFALSVSAPVRADNSSSEIERMTKSANGGNAEAQYNLGVMYDNGQGVPQDYERAAKWYQKAADQGLAHAQTNLGLLYDNGRDVPQDYELARIWYQKAADQGFADAQFNLGLTYYNGQGVRKDYKQAAKWLQKAADQGDAEAQYVLMRLSEQ